MHYFILHSSHISCFFAALQQTRLIENFHNENRAKTTLTGANPRNSRWWDLFFRLEETIYLSATEIEKKYYLWYLQKRSYKKWCAQRIIASIEQLWIRLFTEPVWQQLKISLLRFMNKYCCWLFSFESEFLLRIDSVPLLVHFFPHKRRIENHL